MCTMFWYMWVIKSCLALSFSPINCFHTSLYTIYIYIHLYLYLGSLFIDFSVLQCSIRRSRARYILQWWKKNRETILSSLQAYFVIAHSSGDFILFYDLKSLDQWAITKQASRDESIVSLFFSPFATYIFIFIKCKILTFAKQCSIHRRRAMYILTWWVGNSETYL